MTPETPEDTYVFSLGPFMLMSGAFNVKLDPSGALLKVLINKKLHNYHIHAPPPTHTHTYRANSAVMHSDTPPLTLLLGTEAIVKQVVM